jgi:rare lipoprotein A
MKKRARVVLTGSTVAALLLATVSGHASARHHHKEKAHAQVGVASVYGHHFAGKKTASGKTFKPGKLTAASRELPLNSKAKVTNLETGRSTEVTITDRGPYDKRRVLDLSPAAAKRIGVTKKDGVAPVAVKPIPDKQAAPPAQLASSPDHGDSADRAR